MRLVAWAWLAMAMTVLAGCGPSPEEIRALTTMRDPGTRMVRFTELPYEPLAFPSRTPFVIDVQSPMAEFQYGGRSFTKGFELPPSVGEMRVIVSSTAGGLGRGIFYPIITVLDAEKRPLANTTFDAVREESKLCCLRSFQASMFLPAELRRQARFVLVHTMPDIARVAEEAFEPFQVAQRGPVFMFVPSYEPPPKPPRRAGVGSLVIELAPPIL